MNTKTKYQCFPKTFVLLLFCFLLTQNAIASDAWPGSEGVVVATDSQGSLGSGFEPSGVVYHKGFDHLFLVSDEGIVVEVNRDGDLIEKWYVGGDLEGITKTNFSDNLLYIADEYPASIKELDVSTGSFTGRSWNLSGFMPDTSSQGLEALTFVPNGHHPYEDSDSGGLFYSGLQANANIYVVDVNLDQSGDVRLVDEIVTENNRDLSGLDFSTETSTLYAVFDSSNLIMELEANGDFIRSYQPLPGSNQEGVAVIPSAPEIETEIYIAEDSGDLRSYVNYPVDDSRFVQDEEEILEGEFLDVQLEGKYIFVNDDRFYLYWRSPYKVTVDMVDFYDDGKTEIVVTALVRKRIAFVAVLQSNGEGQVTLKERKYIWLRSRQKQIELEFDVDTNEIITGFGKYEFVWDVSEGGNL